MIKLTIFTPTYNRGHLLTRAYEALKRQSVSEFIWLIVDDGSTDDTSKIVEHLIENEKNFKIQYVKKDKNEGVFSAYSVAIKKCETELMYAIDSDDMITNDGIKDILTFWEKYGSDNYAGIVALDCFHNMAIVGDLLPAQKSINLIDLLAGKYAINNLDRADIVRTKLYREALPNDEVYDSTICFEPHNLHLEISKNYDFLVYNKPLKCIEYQADGLSNNLYKRYVLHALEFAKMRLFYMELPRTTFVFKVKTMIHYVAECMLSKQYLAIFSSNSNNIYLILAFVPGFFLSIYIKIKYSRVKKREKNEENY